MTTPKHAIDLSWTETAARRRTCVVNVKVSESFCVEAEVAPGDFHPLMEEGSEEYSIAPFEFSFDDVLSRRIYELFEQHVINLQTAMRPATQQLLVDNIGAECETKLADVEDDVNCGYDIDARLDVEYSRVADEEELAPFRQFDDMDDDEEYDIEDVDIEDDGIEDDGIEDDDEANPSFRGVEKGRYDGGAGQEVIACSVCLEDLSSGMEFKKLPCSHIFHVSCIDHWLKRNGTCPNCRTKLTKLEEQEQCSDCEI